MNQQATKKIVSFDSIRYKEKFEGVSNLVTPHTGAGGSSPGCNSLRVILGRGLQGKFPRSRTFLTTRKVKLITRYRQAHVVNSYGV